MDNRRIRQQLHEAYSRRIAMRLLIKKCHKRI